MLKIKFRKLRTMLKAWITPSPARRDRLSRPLVSAGDVVFLSDEVQPLRLSSGDLEAKFNEWQASKRFVVSTNAQTAADR